jgi:exosortase/archaeosortase family protein
MINATYTPVLRQLWIKTLAPVQGAILSSLVKFFDSTVAYKMQADSFVISSGAGKLIVKFFCSGFDGLTLFLIIFSILTIYDWNAINKRKLIPIYLSGIILMFFANILRLFLLTVWTLYIPDKLYFDFFHANVGWIIYAIVLGLFEYFTYNWLRR